MSDEAFIIDQVSWHLQTPGNPESPEHIRRRFFSVVSFFQKHGLLKRNLVSSMEDIGPEFAINSADLTDDGLALMRSTYDKWLKKVDRGLSPEDMTLFEKKLAPK